MSTSGLTPAMTLQQRKQYRHELEGWLAGYPFQRAVTLAVNALLSGKTPEARALQLRELAKRFDARLCRRLIGKNWAKTVDFRPMTFFALEKIDVHPHLHGLIWINASGAELDRQLHLIDDYAASLWTKCAPAGSCDVRKIDDLSVAINYAVKSTPVMLNMTHFVMPDEFSPHL